MFLLIFGSISLEIEKSDPGKEAIIGHLSSPLTLDNAILMGLTIIVVYHTFPFPGCLFTYAEKQSKKIQVIIEYAIIL